MALSIIFIFLQLFQLFQFGHSYSEGTKDLLFVQALWRHGDRSPTKTFPSDYFQEDSWKFGGGGWGQLSSTGMKQHLNLGKLLRQRYVKDFQFLSGVYNSKEIYVRSTDVNRTIISAMSNILGQYGQADNNAVPDLDYPVVDGWPTGYIPIAVHTVDDDTDHIGNVDGLCPLQDEVWALAKTSVEVEAFNNSPAVQQLLGNLTIYCNETVTIDNLWIITQALLIEQIYFNDTLRNVTPWFSDQLYATADAINDQVQLFQNGIYDKQNIVNGHDVGLLTRKIRGGPMLNDMMMHMNIKIKCQGQNTPECKWINGLKNYIYSAHDTTIYAFFSALLVEEYAVKPAGYPMYSACVLVELYVDSVDKKPYFKMLYHEKDGANFTPITKGIDGCPQDSDFCSLDVIQKFADLTKPDQPIDQWCFTKLDNGSTMTSSTFAISAFLAAIYSLLM